MKNTDFALSMEERDIPSFFKILHSSDLSSENMRALPQDFVRLVPEKDLLSLKMVLRLQWGKSWEINILRNSRFYYMEKHSWDKFISENSLGQHEFLTFTYHGQMCFGVHIYGRDGKELLRPRNSSSGGFKTEQEKKKMKQEVKEEVKEEPESSSEVSYLGKRGAESIVTKQEQRTAESIARKQEQRTAESTIARKQKHKEKIDSVPRDFVARDSVPEFSITIQKSYLIFLGIPKKFVRYLPEESTMFLIHHPNGKKLWEVTYLVSETRGTFSGGWSYLARTYPLAVYDVCTFKLIKRNEILLTVSSSASSS